MKKSFGICASVVLLFLASPLSSANNDLQVSLRAAIGGSPVVAGKNFSKRGNYYSYPLQQYYLDYTGPTYSAGAYALGVDLKILKWFAVCLDINVTPVWRDCYRGIDDVRVERKNGVSFSVLPTAKFYYFRRPIVMMYGRLGMGFVKYFNYDSLQYWERYNDGSRKYIDRSFNVECQFVPFGMEIGKKVFGYFEFGVGTVYMGAQAGIGYRF